MWQKVAERGRKWQKVLEVAEVIEIARSGRKWQNVAESGRKWQNVAEIGKLLHKALRALPTAQEKKCAKPSGFKKQQNA